MPLSLSLHPPLLFLSSVFKGEGPKVKVAEILSAQALLYTITDPALPQQRNLKVSHPWILGTTESHRQMAP